ncbi:MAG: hypothetical protein J6V21_06645 [Alistipes sp.]|nr:hypothetical protein [Alistipes sp.]
MADEKLIFPIGFDLEEGVKQVQKDWKKHQPEIQKTIDRNPLKLKLELSTKGFNISELKKYIGLSREIAKANREIAKTRSTNALAAQRESRQRVQEATELDQIKQKKAQASLTEERLAQAKQRSANATERQNSAYKTQSGYLQRLFQRMVAYASVTQAFSFIRNIREVTAQFELQRVALGSIIGDLNEANAMFEQIKAAAVKSPFQIKELVTYTKQLAAYKIESDELFETTQRLADISAGLGVGMERLVLAYGQIRATGYLRASEVRQLTEAGIPIVEELAKKMSDLRGETVSAAEVMGLISERAISFGMVKEVFDDMTSAGGMFYKMQEKQAETLAGQWSNLQDSIAIMYEEIGNTEGVNNAMKGMIGLVKSLAENWQLLGNILKITAYQYGAMYAVSLFIPRLVQSTKLLRMAEEAHAKAKKMSNVATQRGSAIMAFSAKQTRIYAYWMRQAANAHTMFGRGVKRLAAMFLGGGWIGAVIGVLTVAVSWFISARKEAKRVNEELAKIGTEGALQADQSVRNFERLAKTIRESADGSREQSEALAELKRTYGDLLPTQDKEILALVKVKEGYEDVTTAIREKINAQIYEQKMNTIISEYGTNLANKQKKPKKWLENMGFSAEETTRIFNAIDKAVQDGLIKVEDNVVTQARKIEKIIKDQTGKVVDLTESQYASVAGTNQTVYTGEKATRLAKRLSDLVGVYSDFNNSVNELADSQKRASNITWEYQEGYDKLKDSIAETNAQFNENTFAGSEFIKANTLAKWREYFISLSDIFAKTPEGGIIDFTNLEDEIEKLPANLRAHIRVVQKEYEKLIPTDITRLANDKLQEYADKVGISMDDVKEHLKNNEQSTEDWANGLKGAYESLEKKLAEYKKNQEAFSKQGAPFKNWSEDIEETTKEMKVLKLLMEFFKEFLSQSDGEKTNPRIAQLKDELSTVEKIYKEYQQLSKYGEEYANKTIAQMFQGVDLKYLQMATSPEKMRKVLEDALRMAKLEGDEELALEIQYKLGKFDADEEQRKLEKSLKDLSDKISRTKTAKEFFDRMLGMTGDKELSATLTLSVYGTTGDDLKSALVKQVEQAFEGIDISDAIDYNTMTINYQKLSEIYAKNQDKILDANKSMAESIVKDGQKTSASQIEQWAKELEAIKTYADKRVDIASQTQQRISEIEASTLPEDEKQRLQEQYRKKEEKDLAKLEYQSFKESPMYVAMFDNLDSASTTMLNNMRAKLMELKEAWGGLDMPTELKEMQSRLNEIDKQLASRNPFKTLANAYNGYQDLHKKGSRKEAEQDLIDKTEKHAKTVALLEMFTRSATQAQQEYNDAVEKYGEDSDQAKSAKKMLEATNILVDTQKKSVDATEEGVAASQELVNKWKELDDVVGGTWVQVNTLTQAIINLGRNLADAFGGFGSDADAEYFNNMADALSNLVDGASNIATGIATSNPISVISGIGSLISGIVEYNDAQAFKENNREIERQQKILDDLSITYERLEKEMNDTFGSDRIKNYNDRLAILQAQQEAYQKQAEEERAKGKKADKEKVKEYEEGYRKATDNIKDMQGELSEYFLGTDLTSAARDFANAWIEAYKEFGSTTDAMKEKFHDMIQNMVVESIAGRMMQELLRPIFDEIERSAEDGELDEREIANIADMAIGLIDGVDDGMTSLMERLRDAGYDIRQSTSGLTGISRDIATASEESILGLAAGINTQNFYISQVPPKLDTIIALLQSGGVQVGGGVNMQDLITIQNQHLSYLPTIAQHTAETVAKCETIVVETRRTADALDKVIKPRGTQSSYTINTTLN